MKSGDRAMWIVTAALIGCALVVAGAVYAAMLVIVYAGDESECEDEFAD